MKNIIAALENMLEKYTPLFQIFNEIAWTTKPRPDKWSKKEELGHLVDSAQNNIRRFIIGQYEEQPYIVYRQDEWAKICNYQKYDLTDLVNLWALLNKHICVVLKNMPADKTDRLVKTQQIHSIQWLADDYVKHSLHHLHHILELEPVAYP